MKLTNNVFVPSIGWVIFGGNTDPLISMSMKLENLRGGWTAGPDLFEKTSSHGQCLIQVYLF